MKKEILYSLRSPYRDQLDIIGYKFGKGKRTIAVVGAMRGNEVQQMYVCSKLVKELKTLEQTEKIAQDTEILIIPCVNYYSMNIGKRFWAMDNTDINRMFPGYNMGETTQRIADGLFSAIQDYEYGIQLASFYQPGNFLPHVKMMDTGFTNENLMKDFGLQYGIVRKPRPYDTTTLNYNWQIWETKSFSVYTNATDEIDEESANEAVDSILRFMNNRGMIEITTPTGYKTELINENDTEQIQSEAGGIFVSMTKIGKRVKKGEVLGKILDPFESEILSEIRSTVEGTVYFEYKDPLINEKTVCYKIIK